MPPGSVNKTEPASGDGASDLRVREPEAEVRVSSLALRESDFHTSPILSGAGIRVELEVEPVRPSCGERSGDVTVDPARDDCFEPRKLDVRLRGELSANPFSSPSVGTGRYIRIPSSSSS